MIQPFKKAQNEQMAYALDFTMILLLCAALFVPFGCTSLPSINDTYILLLITGCQQRLL